MFLLNRILSSCFDSHRGLCQSKENKRMWTRSKDGLYESWNASICILIPLCLVLISFIQRPVNFFVMVSPYIPIFVMLFHFRIRNLYKLPIPMLVGNILCHSEYSLRVDEAVLSCYFPRCITDLFPEWLILESLNTFNCVTCIYKHTVNSINIYFT